MYFGHSLLTPLPLSDGSSSNRPLLGTRVYDSCTNAFGYLNRALTNKSIGRILWFPGANPPSPDFRCSAGLTIISFSLRVVTSIFEPNTDPCWADEVDFLKFRNEPRLLTAGKSCNRDIESIHVRTLATAEKTFSVHVHTCDQLIDHVPSTVGDDETALRKKITIWNGLISRLIYGRRFNGSSPSEIL